MIIEHNRPGKYFIAHKSRDQVIAMNMTDLKRIPLELIYADLGDAAMLIDTLSRVFPGGEQSPSLLTLEGNKHIPWLS